MAPVARSISLPARSGFARASDRSGSVDASPLVVDITKIAPWPAPDPAARVFWMPAPAEFASSISIVDDAVWGPPVAGTAVPGLPAPDLGIGSDAIPTRIGTPSSPGHGRRLLAAIGAAVVAAAGGLALVIALV